MHATNNRTAPKIIFSLHMRYKKFEYENLEWVAKYATQSNLIRSSQLQTFKIIYCCSCNKCNNNCSLQSKRQRELSLDTLICAVKDNVKQNNNQTVWVRTPMRTFFSIVQWWNLLNMSKNCFPLLQPSCYVLITNLWCMD